MVNVALSDADYERFRTLILTRTGLDFPPVRRNDLEFGLRRSLAQVQDALRYHREEARALPALSGLDDLYQALLGDLPSVWDILVDALTVCETHFFRHAQQFEGLRDHVLQPLIADRRRHDDLSLRLWSAGCASGEEAYSLAMLLQETLPDWANWRLDILGTDLNQRSLDRAREAVYRDWSFREAFAQQRRQQYFHHQDTQYILRENVRGMVRFQVCNLVEDCAPLFPDGRKLDVIFCRNVILYFGTNVRRWVYQRLYEALVPGGYLIVGHADPPPPNFTALEARSFPGVTFFQRPLTAPRRTSPRRPDRDKARSSAAPVAEAEVANLAPEAPASGPDDAPPMPAVFIMQGDTASATGMAAAELHYRLGRWHADRQHWEQALQHCLAATRLAPTHLLAHYTLALIYQSLGQSEAAIEALRSTIYLARNWALPHFTAAGIHRSLGQHDHARRELRNVILLTNRLTPDASIDGSDGLTAARLRSAAERQLQDMIDYAGPGH